MTDIDLRLALEASRQLEACERQLRAERTLSRARKDALQQIDCILSDAGFGSLGDLGANIVDRLREAAREIRAWRALADWESEHGKCRAVVFEERSVGGQYQIDATDQILISRDSPQACVVALADHMGLI